jgi:hypothetical protein
LNFHVGVQQSCKKQAYTAETGAARHI